MKGNSMKLYQLVLEDISATQVGLAQCYKAESEQARTISAPGLSATFTSLLAACLRPNDQDRFS